MLDRFIARSILLSSLLLFVTAIGIGSIDRASANQDPDPRDVAMTEYATALVSTSGTYGQFIQRAQLKTEARAEFTEYAKTHNLLDAKIDFVTSWDNTVYVWQSFGQFISFSVQSQPRPRLNFSGRIVELNDRNLDAIAKELETVLVEKSGRNKRARLSDFFVDSAQAESSKMGALFLAPLMPFITIMRGITATPEELAANAIKASGVRFKCSTAGQLEEFTVKEGRDFVITPARPDPKAPPREPGSEPSWWVEPKAGSPVCSVKFRQQKGALKFEGQSGACEAVVGTIKRTTDQAKVGGIVSRLTGGAPLQSLYSCCKNQKCREQTSGGSKSPAPAPSAAPTNTGRAPR